MNGLASECGRKRRYVNADGQRPKRAKIPLGTERYSRDPLSGTSYHEFCEMSLENITWYQDWLQESFIQEQHTSQQRLKTLKEEKLLEDLKEECNRKENDLQLLRERLSLACNMLSDIKNENRILKLDLEAKGNDLRTYMKRYEDKMRALMHELEMERQRVTLRATGHADPHSDEIRWGFFSNGQRVFYPAKVQSRLDDLLHTEEAQVYIKVGSQEYIVDLKTMRQRNIETGFERGIRCRWSFLLDQVQKPTDRMVWESFVGEKWAPYELDVQRKLNDAFSKHFLVKFTQNGVTYFLDIVNMKQKNSLDLSDTDMFFHSPLSCVDMSKLPWAVQPAYMPNGVQVYSICAPGARVSREAIEFNYAYAQFVRFAGKATMER